MARVEVDGPQWSFHSQVITATPTSTTMILVGGENSRPLKLSGLSCELARIISRRCREKELLDRLSLAYPGRSAFECHQALGKFLETLAAAGLLRKEQTDSNERRQSAWRWSLPNPDPIARVLARWILAVPDRMRTVALMVLLLASVKVISTTLALFEPWDRLLTFEAMDYALLFCGVTLWLALHELAHATACRMHDCPVIGMGLMFRGYLLPSLYINTSAMHLVEGEKIRLHVAISGPMLDVVYAGMVAAVWLFFLPDGHGAMILQTLVSVVLLGLYFNLTPFRLSDGLSAFNASFDNTYPTYRLRRGRLRAVSIDARQRAYSAYAAMYITITAAGLLSIFNGSAVS